MEDIKLLIYTAPTRFAKKWKPEEILWSDLATRLKTPTRTAETVAEYKAMAKAEKSQIKDIGGFVAGYIKDGSRHKENIVSRSALTLDADQATADFLTKLENGFLHSYSYVLYSTHSNTEKAPRYRLVIPLSHEVPPEAYIAISRKVAELVDINAMDPTTYEVHRLMYWPSTPKDGEYVYRFNEGEILPPETVLDMYRDWKDSSLWPVGKEEVSAKVKEELAGKKKQDPREIKGLIGAFNRTYSITDAISKFLSVVYAAGTMEGRYSYIKGESSNGLVVYDDLFAYSHHATDPAGGQLCNAFDLVRIHLFGEKDKNAKEGTAINSLPSSRAMFELVAKDAKVMMDYNSHSSVVDDFKNDGEENSDAWMGKFKMSGGKVPVKLPVAFNFLLILHNDPLLKGRLLVDDFAHKAMAKDPLPWTPEDKGLRPWSDTDDSCLRNYLSNTYDLTSKQVIADVTEEVMLENAFNPVKEYYESLFWDGKERAKTLFIDFLGVEDIKHYTREVTGLQLLATVARVMQPGIKYDQCLVLSGPQGIGKSTILRALGREYFNDSITSFVGKDAMVQLQGSTIIELSEMQASNKAENDQIKAFISRQNDRFRMPYGRRMADFPRTCTFYGTTNDYIFLKDRTGGRRFYPLYCTGNATKDFRTELDDYYVDQVWAEVMEWYLDGTEGGKKLQLVPPAETTKVAREIQMQHTEGSEKVGIIKAYLEKELPKNWDEYDDLYDRRRYFETYDTHRPGDTLRRKKVCTLELWCEALGNDKRNYTSASGRELNAIMMAMDGWEPIKSNSRFGPLYGVQRGFKRTDKF